MVTKSMPASSTCCTCLLAKLGYEGSEDLSVGYDDALPLLHEASISGRVAMGSRRGFKVRRVQTFRGRDFALPPRCASCAGYNLHGGVYVKARNRKGLEALCRYIARPPLAKSRLVDEVSCLVEDAVV